MTYTILTLFFAGFAGVLLHNLIKMDSLNRKASGNFNYGQYFRLEKFSILISIIVIAFCAYFSQEVKQLAKAGNWLGLGMGAIGYMAQSVLVSFMGKAKKFIEKPDTDKP